MSKSKPVMSFMPEARSDSETLADIAESLRAIVDVLGDLVHAVRNRDDTWDQSAEAARAAYVKKSKKFDLTPFKIRQLHWRGRVIEADPPLKFQPYLEGEGGSSPLVVVEDKDLDLCAYGGSRQEMLEDLADNIFFIWDEYVNDTTQKMTEGAHWLAETYRSRFRLATDI